MVSAKFKLQTISQTFIDGDQCKVQATIKIFQ